MRVITKPTTAKCNIQAYIRYLLSEPVRTSCTGLSDVLLNISHDSVNRFLLRENYRPEDLWTEVSEKIDLNNGVLSVDDMVIDKPYSNAEKTDLIGFFYSGKHHCVVKGVNVITLYYTDQHDVSVPINFRIIDPDEGKTKNEHFREMLQQVLSWGLQPSWVTGDCWYSSIENLKFIRKYNLGMLFAIENNRIISSERGSYCQVQAIDCWDESGVQVYLKKFGMVKVFRQKCSHSYRYYAVAMPKINMLTDFTDGDFERIHKAHWNIERFHRATKQLCSIEKFQVRTTECIKNHIFCSFIGFIKLECARISDIISNWYQLKKDLFIGVVRGFIIKGIEAEEKSKLIPAVNA